MTTTLRSKFNKLNKPLKRMIASVLVVGAGYGLLELWYAGFSEGWRQAQVAGSCEGKAGIQHPPGILMPVSEKSAI